MSEALFTRVRGRIILRSRYARCRIATLPGHPMGRPESSRLLKVDHCMLHLRIKMRLGGCVASSQNTDADRGPGVVRCFDPGSVTRGTASLAWMCIQGDLKALEYGQAGRVVETTFFA